MARDRGAGSNGVAASSGDIPTPSSWTPITTSDIRWSSVTRTHAAHRPVHGRSLCFELQPLVVRQLSSNPQKHTGVRLFQFGAGLRHAVDLSEQFVLVRWIGGDQRLHDGFFLLHRREEVDQLEPVGIENVVHLLLLIFGQAQFLDELGIVPPASGGTQAHGSPWTSRTSETARTSTARTSGALLRSTVRTARGGLLSKTDGSEQDGYCQQRYEIPATSK